MELCWFLPPGKLFSELFFCSANPGLGRMEFVFIWELARELQEHRAVLPVEVARGCCKWIISPL